MRNVYNTRVLVTVSTRQSQFLETEPRTDICESTFKRDFRTAAVGSTEKRTFFNRFQIVNLFGKRVRNTT